MTTTETLTPQEQEYVNRLVDYGPAANLAEVWAIAAEKFGDLLALNDPGAKPSVRLTYGEFWRQVQQFAAGLQHLSQNITDPTVQPWETELGLRVPPRLALFADNCARWLVADQGSIAAGFANAVRSATAETEELLYILGHSGAKVLIVENQTLLDRLAPRLGQFDLTAIALLSDEQPQMKGEIAPTVRLLNFNDILALGKDQPWTAPPCDRETLATLIYTSGTTGQPKGVMLSHGNLLHQLTSLRAIAAPNPGDRVLTLLPTWHSFGRIGDYYLLSQGCSLTYTNIRNLKTDFKKHKPQYMTAVPRLWESLYEGIQKQLQSQPAKKQKLVGRLLKASERYILAKRRLQNLELDHQITPVRKRDRLAAAATAAALWPVHQLGEKLVYGKIREATGGEFQYAISGGGSLASYLELFFEIVGINVLVGYGLTETAPVLSARRAWANLRGSSGRPIPGTELRAVDPETRSPLQPGQKGLILTRGPQVMAGYFHNPDATAKAIDGDGWFDTGDLGWLSPNGDIVITGRAKDTIVLTNGENIEPQPIEDACARSPYIDQIALVGQDQKLLGALIYPNWEALERWARDRGDAPPDPATANQNSALHTLMRQELAREVKNRPGYKPEERIGPLYFLPEPFSQDNGMMTQTLKIRRPVIADRYATEIAAIFTEA